MKPSVDFRGTVKVPVYCNMCAYKYKNSRLLHYRSRPCMHKSDTLQCWIHSVCLFSTGHGTLTLPQLQRSACPANTVEQECWCIRHRCINQLVALIPLTQKHPRQPTLETSLTARSARAQMRVHWSNCVCGTSKLAFELSEAHKYQYIVYGIVLLEGNICVAPVEGGQHPVLVTSSGHARHGSSALPPSEKTNNSTLK